MQGLFDPARHEALSAPPWSEVAARAALRQIASAAEQGFDARGRLAHPQDDAPDPQTRYFSLYEGNGGNLWALHHLAAEDAIDCSIDFAAQAAPLVELNRRSLEGAQHGHASYLLGDSGLWLLRWRLGDATALQPLFAAVEGNLHNPVREALWGNPGTVLAAIAVAEASGEARWIDLVQRAARALFAEMERDPETGSLVWQQDLYGTKRRLLGAGHGFVGNVFPFLRARRWLEPALVEQVLERALETLQATALLHDGGAGGGAGGGANWHPMIDAARVAGRLPLVQDCHGSPGVVCRLAEAPRTPQWDTLLRAAGELTWHAGPLSKGPTLCHGSAGSAYAMLKLWRRFDEPLWLERAQSLAMHSVLQVEAARERHGRSRDSLWSGDLGVACLLWSCLQRDERFPTVDFF